MSAGAAFAYTVNAVMGSGALALPYAVQQSGYVLGPILLVLMGFLAYVTLSWHFEVQIRALALVSAHDDRTIFIAGTDNSRGDAAGEIVLPSDSATSSTKGAMGYSSTGNTPAKVTLSRGYIQEHDTVSGSAEGQRLIQGTSLFTTVTAISDRGMSWCLKSRLLPGQDHSPVDYESYPSSTYAEIGVVLRLFLGKYATLIWNVSVVLYVILSLWCYVVVWSTTAMIGIPIKGLTPDYLQCKDGPTTSSECQAAQRVYAAIFTALLLVMVLRDWTFMGTVQKFMTGLMYTALSLMVVTSLVAMFQRPFPGSHELPPMSVPNTTTTTIVTTWENSTTTMLPATTRRGADTTTHDVTSTTTTKAATKPPSTTTTSEHHASTTTTTKMPKLAVGEIGGARADEPTTMDWMTALSIAPRMMATHPALRLGRPARGAGALSHPQQQKQHRAFGAQEAHIGDDVVAVDGTHFSGLFGATVFAMLCHSASTLILQSMPSKGITKKIYKSAFTCITLMYIAVAITAALYMGDSVDTLATHNWSNYATWGTPDVKGLGYFLGGVVLFYPMISVTATFYVLARALANSIEEMIPIKLRRSFVENFPCSGAGTEGYRPGQLWPVQLLIRIVLVLVAGGIAIASSSYHEAITFAGLVGFGILFFFPVLLQVASHRVLKQLDMNSTTPYDDYLSHPAIAAGTGVVSVGLCIYYIVTQIIPIFEGKK